MTGQTESGELPKLTGKQQAWLAAYLDPDGEPFNATAAAKRAGYKAKSYTAFTVIGHDNLVSLRQHIDRYFDDNRLSEDRVRAKIAGLMDAKETKVFNHGGVLVYSAELEALGIQLKAAELAVRMKGMLAPEKREHDLGDKALVGAILGELNRRKGEGE